MAKLYLILIVVSLLSGVGYGGYQYYIWSEATINTLRENNVKLKTTAETLQATIEQIQADQKKNEQLNKDLTKRLQQSQQHLDMQKIEMTM